MQVSLPLSLHCIGTEIQHVVIFSLLFSDVCSNLKGESTNGCGAVVEDVVGVLLGAT